jgi:D-alanyl-lipoteichoic acid acyltransferase DltB (MBOAT superfamily)
MLFNSFEFLIFFLVVFLSFWFIFSKTALRQNIFLLLASYVFYAFWDWRFLFLLLFSTLLDYASGLAIGNAENPQKKKWWLWLSIFINIGLLCYFKYANFFIENFIGLLNNLGLSINTWTLQIILPIGISFYTFHGVSYVLDIYYNRIKPTKAFPEYALFVAYFPLLVAGPIERATHLLPQLKHKRTFNYEQGVAGLKLILWGMFKKIVIADSLAITVDKAFENYTSYNGISLITGVVGFSFQIYGDFSGYSDIARGVSKMFGLELIKNFNYPYFSRSIGEYWSRWHISLSSWLNDYVFTPLALTFRDRGKFGIYAAVFLTFLISGIWHGAAWHFIVQGLLFGVYYFPIVYSKKGLKSMVSKKSPDLAFSDIGKILTTYSLVCIGYIFFRAKDLNVAFNYISLIFTSIIKDPQQLISVPIASSTIFYILPILIGDFLMRKYNNLDWVPSILKYLYYIIVGILIFFYFNRQQTFIYFQF